MDGAVSQFQWHSCGESLLERELDLQSVECGWVLRDGSQPSHQELRGCLSSRPSLHAVLGNFTYWLEWPSQSLTCALLQQNMGNKKETAGLLHGQNIQLLQAQVEVADMGSHGHRDGNSIGIQLSLRPAETLLGRVRADGD